MKRLHTIPVGDLEVHSAQTSCWCHPVNVESEIWVHNAKDCRESKERSLNKKVSDGWIIISEVISAAHASEHPDVAKSAAKYAEHDLKLAAHASECHCGTDEACDLHGIPAKHDKAHASEQGADIEQVAEQLHIWYLEATQALDPANYNPMAQKSYADLNEQQKEIDRYIARKVKSDIEKAYELGRQDEAILSRAAHASEQGADAAQAAGAAQQAWDQNLIDQNGKTPLTAIIQSAIEKAFDEGWNKRDLIAKHLESHASEQGADFWRLFHKAWGNASEGNYDKSVWLELQALSQHASDAERCCSEGDTIDCQIHPKKQPLTRKEGE